MKILFLCLPIYINCSLAMHTDNGHINSWIDAIINNLEKLESNSTHSEFNSSIYLGYPYQELAIHIGSDNFAKIWENRKLTILAAIKSQTLIAQQIVNGVNASSDEDLKIKKRKYLAYTQEAQLRFEAFEKKINASHS